MAKKLADYEAKRDFKRTPEPGAKVPISQEMDLVNYVADILKEAGQE